MTPVVHFQDGFLQAQAFQPGLDFLIEDRPVSVQVFVVHAHRQHKVAEFPLGDVPGHLFPGAEGGTDVFQVILRRLVCYVGEGHVGVEEFQGLPFGPADAFRQGHQGIQPAHLGPRRIIGIHLVPEIPVLDKVTAAAAPGHSDGQNAR